MMIRKSDGALVLVLLGAALSGQSALADTLQQEVERLQQRLETLEGQAGLEGASPGAERSRSDEQDDEVQGDADIHIGGALRFNLVHRDFNDASENRYGESGLDVFRFNIDGSIDDVLLSVEYRFYSYMHVLKHGWIGYQFADDSQLQFGINQIPFGLLPYAAHNSWFGVPYYVGLGDNYDMGIKYQRQDGPWGLHLGFYKNEEFADAGTLDRYAFDLVRVTDDDAGINQQNEKVNQFNYRGGYTFGLGSGCETELALSGQAGQLYNHQTDASGDHWAAALHIDSRCGRWGFQLQGASYQFNPENPEGVSDEVVRVGAFGGSYDIDADADIAVANIAYNFNPRWDRIDQFICYNDYSQLLKSIEGAEDSRINTTGCAIGSGPLFVYLDHIYARNMAFLDGDMAGGGDDRWRRRININVGYYW